MASPRPGLCGWVPPWRQPRGKSMVSSVNSHTNASRIGWHLWEIDFKFAPGLRKPPQLKEVCRSASRSNLLALGIGGVLRPNLLALPHSGRPPLTSFLLPNMAETRHVGHRSSVQGYLAYKNRPYRATSHIRTPPTQGGDTLGGESGPGSASRRPPPPDFRRAGGHGHQGTVHRLCSSSVNNYSAEM